MVLFAANISAWYLLICHNYVCRQLPRGATTRECCLPTVSTDWNKQTLPKASCADQKRRDAAQHRGGSVLNNEELWPKASTPTQPCGKWIDWNRMHTNNRQMDTLWRTKQSIAWWNQRRNSASSWFTPWTHTADDRHVAQKYKFCTLIVECKSNLTPPDMVFSIPACHIGVVGVLNSSQLKSPS